MFEQLALGVYYPIDSLLHRLRARTKLLALLWLIGFVTAANQQADWQVAPYGVLLALAGAGALLSGVPLVHLWRRMRLLILLTLIGALLTVLLFEGEGAPLYALGPLLITSEGLWLGIKLLVVFLSLYGLALLVSISTSPVALIEGLTLLLGPLRRLRLPVDEFALMTLLALRFMPSLAEQAERLVKAQTARGADFARGTLRERVQSITALGAPLLQAALRSAAELATALEARGYAQSGSATPLHEGPLARRDYLVLGVLVLVTVLGLMI